MTTLLLLRHAETDAVGKSIAGLSRGWHLNQRGKSQAQELAKSLSELPIRAIYTSPLERAVETAEPIAMHHKLELQRSNEIGELDPGSWTGEEFHELHHREDWRRFNTLRSLSKPPGGESMLEVQRRMVGKLEQIRQKHAEEFVAMVSHADPIRALLTYLLGIPLDLGLRMEISPASVSVVELTEWSVRVMCVNRTGEVIP